MYAEQWRINSSNKAPVLMIKVPGAHPNLATMKRPFPSHYRYHWIRKAVWVWEQEHGPVPDGHAIVQLDGDPANCDPDNLECVPRGVLSRLNHFAAPRSAEGDADGYRERVRLAQLKHAIAERTDAR